MSKRILNSDELDEFMTPKRNEEITSGTRISKKFKNSLDSDEEDDEQRIEKYNVLNFDEFEGQEESTIEHDGEIQITPFNMKEELEEGYFDKEGTYIFHKSEKEVQDQWLDDIDWIKVKRTKEAKVKVKQSDSEEDLPNVNVIDHYKKMIEIMNTGETVQKSIQRLGSNQKQRNSKNQSKTIQIDETSIRNIEKLQVLTELANDIVQNGDMDIYEQTYEKLAFLIKTSEETKSTSFNSLDMFGENFDEDATNCRNAQEKTDTNAETEVAWEFKWELKNDAPIYGPHSTTEMLRWVQEGYFETGVYVRQVGRKDTEFYSSKRIDFELYL